MSSWCFVSDYCFILASNTMLLWLQSCFMNLFSSQHLSNKQREQISSYLSVIFVIFCSDIFLFMCLFWKFQLSDLNLINYISNIVLCWGNPDVLFQVMQSIPMMHMIWLIFTALRPEQNGRHFADSNFKYIFLMKTIAVWLKLHWRLFLVVRLTISQHWFR